MMAATIGDSIAVDLLALWPQYGGLTSSGKLSLLARDDAMLEDRRRTAKVMGCFCYGHCPLLDTRLSQHRGTPKMAPALI